jgi:hydroxymethylbilane synthase
MLLFARPDLTVESVRGNVETRLRKAIDGELDAVVLALAGLKRLHLDQHITEILEAPAFLPAVGQGALGIETHRDDQRTEQLLARLDHPPTHRAVVAERALLAELEGGCMIPLAALARDVSESQLELASAVYDPAGTGRVTATATGPRDDPESLGRKVAELLRQQDAERLLAQIPGRRAR